MWICTDEDCLINLKYAQSIELHKERIEIFYEAQSVKNELPDTEPAARYDFIDFQTDQLAKEAYGKILSLLKAQTIYIYSAD